MISPDDGDPNESEVPIRTPFPYERHMVVAKDRRNIAMLFASLLTVIKTRLTARREPRRGHSNIDGMTWRDLTDIGVEML